MSLNDTVADALTHIRNTDNASKKEAVIKPSSKLLKEVLRVLKENDYISGFEEVADGRDGLIKVFLAGKINECRAIKPRYAVKNDGFEKFEKRYLPSRD